MPSAKPVDDNDTLNLQDLKIEREDGIYNLDNYSLSESIGYLMKRCLGMMTCKLEQQLSPFGLTHPQFSLLMLLTEHDCSTAAELARLTQIDTGSITRMIDRLEAKGVVLRKRSDTDRRIVHILITKDGKEVVKRMPIIAINVMNHYLDHFDAEEITLLKQLLKKLLSRENAENPLQEAL